MIPRLLIDGGHGGSDFGGTGNGLIEKVLNLKVAQMVLAQLDKRKDIEAAMTRYNDMYVSLKDRCTIANKYKADLFISIHHNAANGQAKGYEIYYYTGSLEGNKMAILLGKQFDMIGRPKRYIGSGLYSGFKQGDYYVLKHTNMTAILTEYAFIDSSDYKSVDTEGKLLIEANAIVNAILEYFGLEQEKEEKIQIDEGGYIKCIKKLQEEGIISTPDYWLDHTDKYVKQLIINTANRLYQLTDV